VINFGVGVGSAGDELVYDSKILDDSGAEDATVDQPAEIHLDMGGLTSVELGARGVLVEVGGGFGLSFTQGTLRKEDIAASSWSAENYLQSESRFKLKADFLYRTPTFASYSWFQPLVGARLDLDFARMRPSTGNVGSHYDGEMYTNGDHYFDTRLEGQEITGEDGATSHQSTRLLFGGAVQGGLRIRPGKEQSGWGAAFTLIGIYGISSQVAELGKSQEATFVSRDSSGSAFFSDLDKSKGWGNMDYGAIVFGIELIR
jgi:hypothetical protein